jgi:predicted Zn-dependent protease
VDRRSFVLGCGCFGLCGAFGALHAADPWTMPARLAKPEPGSDEGGLWALLDREETKLKRSRFLVRDAGLQGYVNGIACRVGGEHCHDTRVYVVRTPFFNASMAPNGMMQVWTGLLLRMANEAQLAAVIGHELGHYLARHSLDRLRDAKSRSAFGQFLGMALGAAGVGAAGSVAQLAIVAGMFSYSRDQERDADLIGQELMAACGYPPIEAARVWEQLLAELKAEQDWSGDAGGRSVLFATHPDPEERSKIMAERAAGMAGTDADPGAAGYGAQIAAHRREWLEDELKRRKSGETIALLQRLLQGSDDGELRYFLGEAYRLRGGEGDAQRALAEYQAAASRADCPAGVYRSLGTLQRQAGDGAAARESFRRYLSLQPDAEDAEMIRTYLVEGK